MIFTNRTITVRKGEARIDEPIVIYRGDYELEVRFTIMNSRFRFMSGTNLIDTEKASYGQLAVLTPYGGNVFSDIAKCSDGAVTFVLSRKMLDQIEEVGLYSFQIRLFDYNKESRVSIPPVEFGIEVREPITSEDHDNSVNNAIVGYSIAKVVDPKEENVGDTFDESGNYNKTKWETGDRISEGKLNKIEDAINTVNKNEMNNSASLSKRIDNNFSVLDATKADKNEIFTMANMGQDIKEAMTGGSVAVVGKNAVGSENIIDGSITCNEIAKQYQYCLLYHESTAPVDFSPNFVQRTLKITLPPTSYLITGHMYYLLGENNEFSEHMVSFPNSVAGVTLLFWSKSSKSFRLLNYMDFDSVDMTRDNDMYLIATVGGLNVNECSINMPGVYTINKKSSLPSNSITDEHIKNGITQDTINNQALPIRLCGAGTIRCSFVSDGIQLDLPSYTHVMIGVKYYNITGLDPVSVVVPYPPIPNDGINWIVVDISTGEISLWNFRSIDNIKNNQNMVIIGTANFYGDKSIYLNGDYSFNDRAPSDNELLITFESEIVVDKYNKIIQIPPFYIMKQGVAFRQISPELCNSRGNIDPWYFEFRLPDAYDIHSIYLDYDLVMSWDNGSYNNVNPIKVSKQATNPTVDRGKNTTIPIIATMIYTNVTTKYPLKEVGGVDDIEWCTFNGDGAINFNWVDRTIEFPKSYKFIQHGRKYYAIDESNMIDGYKLRISDDRDGIQWLLFNRHTKQIRTLHYLIEPIDWDQSWLMVATFWINKNVQSISPYKINGKMFGIETTSGQGGMSYDAMDSRLILPDKMYFVKGEDLPIYMTSVIPEPKTIQSIKPSIMYKTDSISTDIDKFSDGYNLSSDKLKNGFRIGYTNYMDDYLYYKDIESEYCDPSSVGFKNPVILHIGDSITNRDIAYRSSLFLNKWGITPTYVGTMNNGNKRGEGREGWTYTNFIGMSSIWNNNGSVINPDDSSETTDLNSNPFLKIATYSDKINNPDICFAHDGVRTEISYSSASESDKSKTFYIFDIANYLSAHNVAKPDIITIALSTNDINSSNEYLNQCLFSMNTMIDRVREQLPDVKIGIIPSPAWGYGHNNFKNKTVKWIEECITSINSRNDPNVFIIPIWCHMNREWGFNINNITISNSNNSMYGWLSDSIHPNENGQQQYAKALSMCICNMLK